MDPSILVLQGVGGFTLGALIGYALRKTTKWLLLLIGFMLLPVFGMWYIGVLDVNWEGVNTIIGRLMEWIGINLSNMSLALTSAGALGISGLLGFFFGVTGGFRHIVFPVEPTAKKYVKRKEGDN